MFTGIIEELGEVIAVDQAEDAARITVRGPLAVSDARHGDSISVSGVCLTVIDQDAQSFTADVMAETLAMSTLDGVAPGRRVNLERAARVGDRLGGHIVQGHIDGTATVLAVTDGSAWRVVRLSLDPEHAPLVARKGSIAGDGVSLTVSAISPAAEPEQWFEVSLIPETLAATTLGARAVGDRLGGHIVQGHIDGTATLLAIAPGEAWRVLRFSLPAEIAPLVVDKGSIAVDGVSLTVSAISPAAEPEQWFEVSLIPETLAVTTLGARAIGDQVNIETDVLARHVERMLALRSIAEARS